MRKWVAFSLTCSLLAGCAVIGSNHPVYIPEATQRRKPSTLESGVDAEAYRYPPSLDKWRRFVQITSRPTVLCWSSCMLISSNSNNEGPGISRAFGNF